MNNLLDDDYTLSGLPTTKRQIDKTAYINNIITLYDINGKVVKKYEGRFAILHHDSHVIIFQKEDGEKHTIHISTGFVTIDQI